MSFDIGCPRCGETEEVEMDEIGVCYCMSCQWERSREHRGACKRRVREERQASEHKIQRNDPCFCGSGKKFKRCCMNLKELGRYAASLHRN